jgi:hypothetical protein
MALDFRGPAHGRATRRGPMTRFPAFRIGGSRPIEIRRWDGSRPRDRSPSHPAEKRGDLLTRGDSAFAVDERVEPALPTQPTRWSLPPRRGDGRCCERPRVGMAERSTDGGSSSGRGRTCRCQTAGEHETALRHHPGDSAGLGPGCSEIAAPDALVALPASWPLNVPSAHLDQDVGPTARRRPTDSRWMS